jgi:hypothetical protein
MFIIGSLTSIAYLALLTKVALITGATLLLFPELGALAYDVFTRPAGGWAQSPVMLMVTPTASAIVGALITNTMPYGLWSNALGIAGALMILYVLRSPVSPSLSAALLPLTLGVTSWRYPIAIALGTSSLVLVSLIYNRSVTSFIGAIQPVIARVPDCEAERAPAVYRWLPVFAVVMLLAYGLSVVTGLRLVLFPPLIPIAFEMLAHEKKCPWAARPFALVLICTITAGAGALSVQAFGTGVLSIAVAMLVGIATLRTFRLHVPPALAVGLLPQVISGADWRFVCAIALGTGTLSAIFLLVRSPLFPWVIVRTGA